MAAPETERPVLSPSEIAAREALRKLRTVELQLQSLLEIVREARQEVLLTVKNASKE